MGICLRHTVTRKLVNVANLITLVRFNLILREPADLSRLVNNYLLFYYFLQLFLFEQEQWRKVHTEMKLHTQTFVINVKWSQSRVSCTKFDEIKKSRGLV